MFAQYHKTKQKLQSALDHFICRVRKQKIVARCKSIYVTENINLFPNSNMIAVGTWKLFSYKTNLHMLVFRKKRHFFSR
jgi:hypothetical protein